MWVSVQNPHSRIPLRDLLCGRMREMRRKLEVLEAEAQVGKWFDCRARITLKELAPIHSVKSVVLVSMSDPASSSTWYSIGMGGELRCRFLLRLTHGVVWSMHGELRRPILLDDVWSVNGSCNVGICFVFGMVQYRYCGWRGKWVLRLWSSNIHARRDAMCGFLFVLTWIVNRKTNFETSYAAVLMLWIQGWRGPPAARCVYFDRWNGRFCLSLIQVVRYNANLMRSLCVSSVFAMTWMTRIVPVRIVSKTKQTMGRRIDVQKFIRIQISGHNWRRAKGIRVECLPRRFTTLQLCHKVQEFMSKMSDQPEKCKGRIVLMSMLNDISWGSKDNKRECASNAQIVSLYAKRLEQDNGHSSYLDQRKSGSLLVKTVHKEKGTELRSKWCWHLQKAHTLSSDPRVHCPEECLRAKVVENCRYTIAPILRRLKMFLAQLFLLLSSVFTGQS